MDRVNQPAEEEALLLSASASLLSPVLVQEQLIQPSQKRRMRLSPKKKLLFSGLALIIILSLVCGVMYVRSLPGNERWSFQGQGQVTASPMVINGTVYVSTRRNGPTDADGYEGSQGMFSALDAATGDVKWSFDMDGENTSSPVVINGVLCVSTSHSNAGYDQGVLSALNATTGHQEWSYPIISGVNSSSPIIVNGLVYVISQNGTLDALAASSGSKQWSFSLGSNQSIYNIPTVASGLVYIDTITTDTASSLQTNTLAVLDATTGAKKWSCVVENATGPEIMGRVLDLPPIVSNGLVYVPSLHGIHAFDAVTGSLKWIYQAVGGIYFSPIVSNGMFYLDDSFLNVNDKSILYALDASSGQLRWSHQGTVDPSLNAINDRASFADTGAEWSLLAVSNGVVYVSSNSDSIYDNLYAFDAISGRQKWSQSIEGPTPSAPIVIDGTVYVSSINAITFAFNATTGQKKWSYAAGPYFQTTHGGPGLRGQR